MSKNKGYTANKNGYRCNTVHCAKYANDLLRTAGYSYAGGDAWSRKGPIVYNGYENTTLNRDTSVGRLLHGIDAAKDIYKNFKSDTLNKDKIYQVNMFYRGSPYIDQAYKDSDRNGIRGTHTGNLYWDRNTNSWRVEHNIHGTIHNEDWILLQRLGANGGLYGPTAILEAPSNFYGFFHSIFKTGGKVNYLQYLKYLLGGTIQRFYPGGFFNAVKVDKSVADPVQIWLRPTTQTREEPTTNTDADWYNIIDEEPTIGSTSGSATSGNATSERATSSQTELMLMLEGAGLSRIAAAGIVGNLGVESGYRHDIEGDKGTSYGLAQWHNERRDNLFKFAGTNKPSTLKLIQFLLKELKEDYPNTLSALQAANSPEEAAEIFMTQFERPAMATANLNRRLQLAIQASRG